VPWSAPAARLREYVEALRAIWRCYEQRAPLAYAGEHYRFNLMTPEFAPKASGLPPIPVYTAAVRPAMIRTCARVADGVRLHPFCTRRYHLEVVAKEIEQGLAQAGRSRAAFEVCGGGFVITAADQAGLEKQREAVRYRVAFYGSTPSYRPVLELHGWGELAGRLHQLSRSGQWKQMPRSSATRCYPTSWSKPLTRSSPPKCNSASPASATASSSAPAPAHSACPTA